MRKFSINEVKKAYENAAISCDKFYQLTADIKIAMCDELKCDPSDLQSWFLRASDEQFERAIF